MPGQGETMRRKLIADGGSTKVEWVLLSPGGVVEAHFSDEGLNALLATREEVEAAFAKARERISEYDAPEEIYFYGAGCATEEICRKIEDALLHVWPEAKVSAASDLLGAARSLLGHRRGIACILGTGSNSCLYDGENIAMNVPSLGYVLGDEGSGAALGKRLVADVFKHQLPETVRKRFLDKYGLTLSDILDKTYRKSAPNRFLASLVPFLKENLWNPYIYSLVHQELRRFVKRNVAMYDGARSLPVCFTGSIASVFHDILEDAMAKEGYKTDTITKSPIDGLIAYHGEK